MPSRSTAERPATAAGRGRRWAAAGAVADDGVPTETYDRVVRIVAWVFLLAAAFVVIDRPVAETQPAILVLFALDRRCSWSSSTTCCRRRARPRRSSSSRAPSAITFGDAARRPRPAASPARSSSPSRSSSAAPRSSSRRRSRSPRRLRRRASATPRGPRRARPDRRARDRRGRRDQPDRAVLLAYVAMVIAREQRRSRDAAIRLSTVDSLTGLFNRTFFFAARRARDRPERPIRARLLPADDGSRRAQADQRPATATSPATGCCAGVGDVIIAVGVRQIDTAARYGGDEFVVLLPETDPTGAFVLAEKIRLGVAPMPVEPPAATPSRRSRSASSLPRRRPHAR